MPSNRIFLGLHFVVAKCKSSQIIANISHLGIVGIVYANSLLATWVACLMQTCGLQFNLVLQSQCQKANMEWKPIRSYTQSTYAYRLSGGFRAWTWIFDHATGIGKYHGPSRADHILHLSQPSCGWTLLNRKQCPNGGNWCVTLPRILSYLSNCHRSK